LNGDLDELQMVQSLEEAEDSGLLELWGASSMTLRQCDMMSLKEIAGKPKIWCNKNDRKSSLNKCNKCIKKTEAPKRAPRTLVGMILIILAIWGFFF
jgi:hypothetical protein